MYGRYRTQQLVATLKADLECSTRLTCWMDVERMGVGCNLADEMSDGVRSADVFVCCLTDHYLGRMLRSGSNLRLARSAAADPVLAPRCGHLLGRC